MLEYVNIQSGTVDKNVPTRETFNLFKAKAQKITLDETKWNEKQQTVSVNDVLADESLQLILVIPSVASISTYRNCNCLAISQNENSLTFKCNKIPTIPLDVYVTIQKVKPTL